ncbi:hypothetical protein CYY_007943 [Polysphondylium violaceum]|uniref:tRNA-dihydrouridine(47) synthase [NAD(P)(+)] n=1 Tax=Polysphondylium violaceum TaxID=133409 RepID=A0A8J4PR57_9MYCE|nr:hypothetical protein CYY_007943 [Polysphondylium violaceum]
METVSDATTINSVDDKKVEEASLPTPATTTTDDKSTSEIIIKAGEARIKQEFLLPVTITERSDRLPPKTDNKKGKQAARINFPKNEDKLCVKIIQSGECDTQDTCKYSHDIEKYLESKPPNLGKCILFEQYGKCRFGLACLFGKDHIEGNKSIVNQELASKFDNMKIINEIPVDIQLQLKKNMYPFTRCDEYFKKHGINAKKLNPRKQGGKNKDTDQDLDQDRPNKKIKSDNSETSTTTTTTTVSATGTDEIKPNQQEPTTTTTTTTVVQEDSNNNNIKVTTTSHEGTEIHIEVPLKACEKKKIDFKNQLYLAPLTTVGNLPFRRICKKLGVDITCGEMAFTTKMVEGTKSELALMKRHPSEDKFGIQLAGAYVDTFLRCAEFIENEVDCDFVDINAGCPIDLVCNSGAGAALCDRPNKIEQLLRGASSILTCPVTIKMRIGKLEDSPNAHKIIPNLQNWGASAVTLHGRSRAQRYSRLANWEYVAKCAEVSPIPLIGNGDLSNYQDALKIYDTSKVSSLMIARGALIKPWIFTEIKEKRVWDITPQERLDLYKDYVNYGLDHFGSDQIGVDNTRKFLLNWLSFTHRYIPAGLLEDGYIHKMNERPPNFFGRSEMETLLASNKVSDWIKISEMFLGPVNDSFSFVPKHNSNSYEAQG